MWLENRQYNEGPGIWLSDGWVFHPGLGLEGGYDTNALHRSENVEGAGRIRLTPYIDFATEPPQRRVEDEGVVVAPPKVDFRWGLAAFYDHYFSDDEAVSNQSDVGVDTTLNLELFPYGTWTLILFDNYMRSKENFETANEAGFNRDSNVGKLAVRYSPGGRALEFQLGYANHLDYYEEDTLSYGSYMGHEVQFDAKWRFFPKTALVLKTSFMPTFYFENRNSDLLPLRLWLGLNGLFTERFGLLILLGYGNGFYYNGPNFNSFIGRLEATYFIGPFSNLRIGVERDFQNSMWANFYDKIGGYVKYTHLLLRSLLLGAKVGVYYRDYSETPASETRDTLTLTYSTTDRWDIWLDVGILAEYRVLDWLGFYLTADYMADFTDFEVTGQFPGGPAETRKMDFQKFLVLGGVRFSY